MATQCEVGANIRDLQRLQDVVLQHGWLADLKELHDAWSKYSDDQAIHWLPVGTLPVEKIWESIKDHIKFKI